MTNGALALARIGGVAHSSALQREGLSQKQVEREVSRGTIERIRSGWYCLPGNPRDAVMALRVGGRLGCVSLLRGHGVWLMDDDRLHVTVSSGRRKLRSPLDRSVALEAWGGRPAVATHWQITVQNPLEPTDMIDDAAACVALCLPRDHAIVAFDSILNSKMLTTERLRTALAGLPDSHEWMMDLVDAGCGSGLETFARLRLRSHNVRVRSQVHVPGIGWIDLLIGDRLIVELDSRTHHDNPAAYERDRERDLALIERGYVVARVTHRKVMKHWDRVEQALLAIIRRGEHHWQPVHRAAGLAISVE